MDAPHAGESNITLDLKNVCYAAQCTFTTASAVLGGQDGGGEVRVPIENAKSAIESTHSVECLLLFLFRGKVLRRQW